MIPFFSSDLVKVDPSDGSLTSYPCNYPTNGFVGGVFDGESIWMVPHNSSAIIKIDPTNPTSGSHVSYPHNEGINREFAGGCFDGESIWLAPYNSDNIIKINPVDGTLDYYPYVGGSFFWCFI